MCLLKLYELYLSKCDPKRPENIFYFRPKTTQNRNIWYTCSAIGHNTLAGTVKQMFDTAGIPGFFTIRYEQQQPHDFTKSALTSS